MDRADPQLDDVARRTGNDPSGGPLDLRFSPQRLAQMREEMIARFAPASTVDDLIEDER